MTSDRGAPMTGRDKLIEAMARAMCEYNGEDPDLLINVIPGGAPEDREPMWMSWQQEACRGFEAIGEAKHAVVPLEATIASLAAGWGAINKGRTKPVDMAPGPALREAYPAMVAAADLTSAASPDLTAHAQEREL